MKERVSNGSVQQSHTFTCAESVAVVIKGATQVNDLDTSQKDTVLSLLGKLEMSFGEQCNCVRCLSNDNKTRFPTATETLFLVL